eukprot:scaffold8321_cov138-Isochrysis_galbana.AAC.1
MLHALRISAFLRDGLWLADGGACGWAALALLLAACPGPRPVCLWLWVWVGFSRRDASPSPSKRVTPFSTTQHTATLDGGSLPDPAMHTPFHQQPMTTLSFQPRRAAPRTTTPSGQRQRLRPPSGSRLQAGEAREAGGGRAPLGALSESESALSPGVVQTQPAPRKRRRIPTFWAYAHYHCVRTHLYPPVFGIRDPVCQSLSM